MAAKEIPSPVGGWNARDALSAMAETDAVDLRNWVPSNGIVTGRGGSVTKLSLTNEDGALGPVETLMVYEGDAATKFLAACAGFIFDITSFAQTEVASGFTNSRWQTGAFDNNLVLVNGADDPQVYDGSSLTPMTITSGPTGTDLVGVVPFKGRAFYWENSSASFWYAEAGSFQGVLTEFPLATFTQHGGVISQIVTWTRDANDGVDDLCAIIFNTGEVLVYQGDDPADNLRWSMVGRWLIGKPINVRSHGRYNSAEIIGTSDCFLGLDEAIMNTPLENTFGGRVVRAAAKAASTYGDNFGWQFLFYPGGNLFLVNVPTSATQATQYVKNTNTGAWTQFTGWPALCMAVFNKRLYFGTPDGRIVLADTNNNDPIQFAFSDDGEPIVYYATTAYQKFGEPGLKSQLTACRVVTTAFDPSAISLNAFADYKVKSPLPPIDSPIEQVQAQWDISDWDTDYWAGEGNDPITINARPSFRPVQAFGFAIALNVRYQSKVQNLNWYSTEFVFLPGGIV